MPSRGTIWEDQRRERAAAGAAVGPSLLLPDPESLLAGENVQALLVPKASSPYIDDLTGNLVDGDWTTPPSAVRDYFDNGQMWAWGAAEATTNIGHLQITGGMCVAALCAVRTVSAGDGIAAMRGDLASEIEDENALWSMTVPATNTLRYVAEYGAGLNALKDWTSPGDFEYLHDLGVRFVVMNRTASGDVTLYVNGVEIETVSLTAPTGGSLATLCVGASGPWRMLLVEDAFADASRLAKIHAAVGLEVA